jgi:hypothetical protein
MTRSERAAAVEQWADIVSADDLVLQDTSVLRAITQLADRRKDVDAAFVDAIRSARAAGRSWGQISTMLGESEQATRRKYENHSDLISAVA